MPHIKGATNTNRPFGNELARAFNVHRADDNSGHTLAMRNLGALYGFLDVYGIKLLSGRNFSPADYNPDWQKLHTVVINSSAVKLLGFASNNDAIGQSIMVFNKKWDVIGVMNDFHHKSLRYAIEPLILLPAYGTNDAVSIKVDTKDLPATIAAIKKKYDEFFPGNLFDYFFMDDRFNAQYSDDQFFGKVYRGTIVGRIYKIDTVRFCDSHAYGVVHHASMAAELCLSHWHQLVDLRRRRFTGADHCVGNHQLSGG